VDVAATLAAWDLARLASRPFAALSGGERQRLFLALALLGRPEVVFLDELTTGLDPQARRATWELVRGVRDRGTTVVLVTHVMEEAEHLCDRVAIVDEGRVVATDRPAALTAGLAGAVEVAFTLPGAHAGCLPRFLADLPGVGAVARRGESVVVSADAAAVALVAAALVERGLAPADLRTRYPSLEDVFLATTGHRLAG
jgi:ABC-2 type transport system ATP-binding protein